MWGLFLKLPRYLIFIFVVIALVLILFISSVATLQLRSAKEGPKQTLLQSISASFKPIINTTTSILKDNSSSISTNNITSSTGFGISMLTASGLPIVNMNLATDKKSLSADIPATGINFDNSLNYYDPAYTVSLSNPVAKTPDTRFSSKDIAQFVVPDGNLYNQDGYTKITFTLDIQCRKSWSPSSDAGKPFYAPIDYPCSSYPTGTNLFTNFYLKELDNPSATVIILGSVCTRSSGATGQIATCNFDTSMGKNLKLYYYGYPSYGTDSIVKTAQVKSVTVSPLYPPIVPTPTLSPTPTTTPGLPDYQPDVSSVKAKLDYNDKTPSTDVDITQPIGLARNISDIEFSGIKINNIGNADAQSPRVIIYVQNPEQSYVGGDPVVDNSMLSVKKVKIYDSDDGANSASRVPPIKAGGSFTIPTFKVNLSNNYDDFSVFEDNNMANLEIVVDPLNGSNNFGLVKEANENNNSAVIDTVKWVVVDVYFDKGDLSDEYYQDYYQHVVIYVYKLADDGKGNAISKDNYPSRSVSHHNDNYLRYYYSVSATPPNDNLKYYIKTITGSQTTDDVKPQPPGYINVNNYLTYKIPAKTNNPDLVIYPALMNINGDNGNWAPMDGKVNGNKSNNLAYTDQVSTTIQQIDSNGNTFGSKFTNTTNLDNSPAIFNVGDLADDGSKLTEGNYTIISADVVFGFNYGTDGNLGWQEVTAEYPTIDPRIKPLGHLQDTSQVLNIKSGGEDSIELDMFLGYKCLPTARPNGAGNIPICVYGDETDMTDAGFDGTNITANKTIDTSIVQPMQTVFGFKNVYIDDNKSIDVKITDDYIDIIYVEPFVDNSMTSGPNKTIVYDTRLLAAKGFGSALGFHEMSHILDYYLGQQFQNDWSTDYTQSKITGEWRLEINQFIDGMKDSSNVTWLIDPIMSRQYWEAAAGQCANTDTPEYCDHHHLRHEYDQPTKANSTDGIFEEVFAEQLTSVCWLDGKNGYDNKLQSKKTGLAGSDPAKQAEYDRDVLGAYRIKGPLNFFSVKTPNGKVIDTDDTIASIYSQCRP